MNNKTCASLLLFYTYKYYKRRNPNDCKKNLIYDMTQCQKILNCMKDNLPIQLCFNSINNLVTSLNSYGVIDDFDTPEIYGDYENQEIVLLMLNLTEKILTNVKRNFWGTNNQMITQRLMAIYNLPRVLIANVDEVPELSKIHISLEETKNIMNSYLKSTV